MEELSIQFFPPRRTNLAPLESANKEAEGPSSYDGYAGSRDGRPDLEDVDIMKYDSTQIIPNKNHPRTGFQYPPMFIHYGVSRKNWQSFVYFISNNLTSFKDMKGTFDARASVDWLIERNRHYFEPKGLHVDLAWRGENYWNLDVVDSKGQHSHLGQACDSSCQTCKASRRHN